MKYPLKWEILEGPFKIGKRYFYKCKCQCGQIVNVRKTTIGKSSFSCKRCATNFHGFSKTNLHKVWLQLRDRCNNKNNPHYKYYGKKNIKVCKEWDNFLNFKNWSESNGYKQNLSIDRIDSNKNYEPSNCRWVTRLQQTMNRTNTIFIDKEKTKTLRDFLIENKIPYSKGYRLFKKGTPLKEISENYGTV